VEIHVNLGICRKIVECGGRDWEHLCTLHRKTIEIWGTEVGTRSNLLVILLELAELIHTVERPFES
jgi:hypothetical protein